MVKRRGIRKGHLLSLIDELGLADRPEERPVFVSADTHLSNNSGMGSTQNFSIGNDGQLCSAIQLD